MGGQPSKSNKLNRHIFPLSDQGRYMRHCVPLHKAALKGDWEAAERLLEEDPTLIQTPITENGETAFHIAALEGHSSFFANLLEFAAVHFRHNHCLLEMQNQKGSTALSFAAAGGHVHIAHQIMDSNKNAQTNLAQLDGSGGVTPLYLATLLGYAEMADYLFPFSGVHDWPEQNQIDLLTTAIESGFYDLAMKTLSQNQRLAVAKDRNGDTPLQVLAQNPSAFCGRSRRHQQSRTAIICTAGSRILSQFLPGNWNWKDDESYGCDAYTLLGLLLDCMISCHQENTVESGDATTVNFAIVETAARLLFEAAESENDEFMVELIRRYPDLLSKVNESRHSIFHLAVLHRHVQAFNLLYELRGVRDMIATHIDTDGNNMLHLAAKLAPSAQLNLIPGAALQMQREVLWYKAVENMVRPSYRKMKNSNGETPHDVFIAEHKNLMKEGEKLMKQTAKSCMLVTILIVTVVFTSAFTVPGGFDNTSGAPTLQRNKLFFIFPVSEAVAMLSSLISMLMFLSILTCRYSEKDFLEWLPFWLVIGMTSLFVSIVTMMATFCGCLIFYVHGTAAVLTILVCFACVPVIFVYLHYSLILSALGSTYGGRWLFRSGNRLFSVD